MNELASFGFDGFVNFDSESLRVYFASMVDYPPFVLFSDFSCMNVFFLA